MKYTPPVGGAANDPYIDANPGVGIDGSPVPAAAIEDPQREIVAVIVAAGLTPDENTLNQLLTAIQSFQAILPGTIIEFGGPATPAGYLLCDGAAVSRATYAALFTAIGTNWGVGDGATTFNLPDLRGRASIGSGQGSGLTDRTLGQTGGEEAHVLTISEMPAHTHTVTRGGDNNGTGADRGDNTEPDMTTGSQGGGAAHNTMQPYAVVRKCIKT